MCVFFLPIVILKSQSITLYIITFLISPSPIFILNWSNSLFSLGKANLITKAQTWHTSTHDTHTHARTDKQTNTHMMHHKQRHILVLLQKEIRSISQKLCMLQPIRFTNLEHMINCNIQSIVCLSAMGSCMVIQISYKYRGNSHCHKIELQMLFSISESINMHMFISYVFSEVRYQGNVVCDGIVCVVVVDANTYGGHQHPIQGSLIEIRQYNDWIKECPHKWCRIWMTSLLKVKTNVRKIYCTMIN